MNDVCEHGSLLLPPGTPWPAGAWTPYCRTCWKAAGGVKRAAGVTAAKTTRRGKCLHLGVRTEYRPGCGGWRCSHQCEAGEPVAVPGGNCQSCPKWEPEA